MSTQLSAGTSITPIELSERMQRGETPRIVDVREPIEFQIAQIEGAVLIPLAELPSRIGELRPDEELVVLCHHGIRSQHACVFLRAAGFTLVRNLTGGIDRWAEEVDPSIARY